MSELARFVTSALTRPKLATLERELSKLPQLRPEMKHYFAPGIYAREIFLPAGCCVTGKIHKHEHLSIVLGDITVKTEFGDERITGFQTRNAPPGVKRAVFTHADTWWTTIHHNPTDERDLSALEAIFIAPSFEALDRFLEAP